MSKLNIELFVARRLGSGGGTGAEGRGKRVMVRIAVATVTLAVAVMILAVAVIGGFRAEITDKITAFTGHVNIRAVDFGLPGEDSPVTLSPVLEREIAALPGVRSVGVYDARMGIAKTAEATQGLMLKGVGAGYDLSFFERALVEGTLPRVADTVRHKDLLISVGVARMLRLGVDDRLEMLFVEGDRPRRDRFRVCGLYSSGFTEMDDRFAITDLASVQRLAGHESDRAAGYEIVLTGMDRIPAAVERVGRLVEEHGDGAMVVSTVVDDYPQHFDWLATHDVNAAVIIVIMVVVALISMVSALLVIVLERIRMIGILKTLGMTGRSLRRVFVLRAMRIVGAGLAAGNILGVGLALAQLRWGVMKLDSSGYSISQVPIDLGVWWIALLDVGVFVVIAGFMIFPTSIVGRIDPAKTVRYQ